MRDATIGKFITSWNYSFPFTFFFIRHNELSLRVVNYKGRNIFARFQHSAFCHGDSLKFSTTHLSQISKRDHHHKRKKRKGTYSNQLPINDFLSFLEVFLPADISNLQKRVWLFLLELWNTKKRNCYWRYSLPYQYQRYYRK